jgi:hypothetical protein
MAGEESKDFPGIGKPGPQPTDIDTISSMMQGDAQYLALRANVDQAEEQLQNAKAYQDALKSAKIAVTSDDFKAIDNVSLFKDDAALASTRRSADSALSSASNRLSSARAQLGAYETAFRQRALAADNQRSGQMVTVNGRHYYVSVDSKGNTKSTPVAGLPDATVAGRQPISISSVDETGRQTVTFYNPDTLTPFMANGKAVSIDTGPAQANYNTSQSIEYLAADIAPGGQAGFYKVRRDAAGKPVMVNDVSGSGKRVDAEFVSAKPAPQVATSYVMSGGQGVGIITYDPTANNGAGGYTQSLVKISDQGAADKFTQELLAAQLANKLSQINLDNAKYDSKLRQMVGVRVTEASVKSAEAAAEQATLNLQNTRLDIAQKQANQMWDMRKKYVMDLFGRGLITEKQAYDYMADQATYLKLVAERQKQAGDARTAALREQEALREEERATGVRTRMMGYASGRNDQQQAALMQRIASQAQPGESVGQTIRRLQGAELSSKVQVPQQYVEPTATQAQTQYVQSHPNPFAGSDWDRWMQQYQQSIAQSGTQSLPSSAVTPSNAVIPPVRDDYAREATTPMSVPKPVDPMSVANDPARVAQMQRAMSPELSTWQALAAGQAMPSGLFVPPAMSSPIQANPYDAFDSWLQSQSTPNAMPMPADVGA